MSDARETSPDYAMFKHWEAAVGSTRRREPPDAAMLAAYVDGTLDAAACAAVEAALACDPDLIAVVFGDGADAGSGDAPVSRDLMARLQALVPPSDVDRREVVSPDRLNKLEKQSVESSSRSDLTENRPPAAIIAFPSSGRDGRMGRLHGWRRVRGRPLTVRAAMAASLVFMSVAGFSAGISVERAINHDELHDAMLDFDEAALMDENVG